MNLEALLGKKLGMTQIFDENGRIVPVTVIEAGPCTVMQVRTVKNDGYAAVQLGFEDQKRTRATKPETGHAKKAKAEPKKFVREVNFHGEPQEVELGGAATVELFQDVQKVDIIGTSKGKGFQGAIKRWNFQRGDMTHGSKSHRRPGSSGAGTTPGRVRKGKKMSGHMGDVRRTNRSLRVAKIDPERNLLFVQGSVPGPRGAYVLIRRSVAERTAAAK